MDASDQNLLQQFTTHRSEDAFRLLVDRHVGMVFSVARRVTGDNQLAEEVAQTTFATLAEKAGTLANDNVIAGWLYHTARHQALRAIRSEQRRRQREKLAVTMNTDEPNPSVVAAHLESTMDQLKSDDRDVLVLRFFEDRTLRDIGHELGLSEDAARMRVNRALEKLRGVFGKLGFTGSAASLGTTLTGSANASMPIGLGASVSTAVLKTTAAIVTQTTSSTMTLFNLKTAVVIIGASAVIGTTIYVVHERNVERLRTDYQTLNETHVGLTADQQQALAIIKLRDDQIQQLKKDADDVHRLRGEVTALRRQLAERYIRQAIEQDGSEGEPIFQGIGLTEWLNGLYWKTGERNWWSTKSGLAATAIKTIGGNAIPHLILILGGNNREKIIQAAIACELLGKEAKAAGPALVKHLQSGYPASWEDYVLQDTLLSALYFIGEDAEIVVPILMSLLQDSNPRISISAAEVVTAYGVEGAPAISVLREVAKSQDTALKKAASHSLRAIEGAIEDLSR